MKPLPEGTKKKIIIDDYRTCIVQQANECDVWKKLTKKERFIALCGVGIPKFILDACKLDNEL